jgi:hypothetical protein
MLVEPRPRVVARQLLLQVLPFLNVETQFDAMVRIRRNLQASQR